MKVIVLFSGGLDSTVLMASKLAQDCDVIALSVNYGQRHIKELQAAEKVIDYYRQQYREKLQPLVINLSNIFGYGDVSSLLQGSRLDIPHNAYTVAMPNTYVPFRNGLMLSVATSVALQTHSQHVAYAAHANDAANAAYPDCSKKFVQAMDLAIVRGTGGKCTLQAPFVKITKAKVVELGLKLAVPFHLTWSCYEGGVRPCGKCGTCIDRALAFEANGIKEDHHNDNQVDPAFY